MQARLYEFLQNKGSCELLLCEDDKEASDLEQIALFCGLKSFVLPDLRADFGQDLRSFSKELFTLCKVLNAYYKCKEQKILISPVKTILNKLPSAKHLANINLKLHQKIRQEKISDELVRSGYNGVDIVEDFGEFSLRGDVLDIFPLNYEKPVRILFFDDEIESLRFFELSTQKSIPNELQSVEICPFLTHLNEENFSKINDKLTQMQSEALVQDFNALGFWCIDDFKDYLSLDFRAIKEFEPKEFECDISQINAKALKEAKIYKALRSAYNKDFFALHQRQKITLLASNEALVKQLGIEFADNVKFVQSPLRVNLSSNDELIISLNKEQGKKAYKKASLIIDELKKGDFITHEDYGVGKFLGLELIKIAGAKKEFVALEYLGGDKLLLPVENLALIDKFIASSVPNLDKLGKSSFIKIKEKLRQKLFAIASQLVALAAKRELIEARKIKIDFAKQLEFSQSANFTYTDDQEKACEAILNDFEKGKLMDRLLSADVGFGKTEVAMNAIFAVLQNKLSALFFVPTTLLSHQHYKNLSKRFKPFGIEVFRLDRFTSAKEKKLILEHLKEQKPCVVIGTHALLNVKCENLGLIIIDEEHKFGVKQKEALKELSSKAHILSMSATPIPRSLNLALSSVKSYSILQTPPQNRLDVRTFVKLSNDALLKEAINRELRRGGQIFYIHNHIASINESKKRLQSLMPQLRILVLHSKIEAKLQEEQMLEFENKQYDLLLSTSIVESGIDLPNVNTIIVENSQNFGMADLHQLRGRVGRSDRQGYCYFLVGENLSDEAKKRLVSLESNSYLGAGSVLAYHDLEIRGAGNLLGSEQSGHIEQIGYSLYLKMLEDEINALSKKSEVKENKIELKLNINAFLNAELINADRLRLELYRRLSKCESVNEVYEIESEINERFGKPDIYTRNFLELIIIKILASKNYKLISNFEANIQFISLNDEKLILKAPSKDESDILATILTKLRKENT